MTPEEFDQLLRTKLQEFDVTVERIPPKKESSGTRKVQFFMVKNPRPTEPTSPCESSDTQAGD